MVKIKFYWSNDALKDVKGEVSINPLQVCTCVSVDGGYKLTMSNEHQVFFIKEDGFKRIDNYLRTSN